MSQIDLKHATLYLRDGTSPTKKTLEVKIGTGTFTYDEKKNMEYQKDRGNLDVVREGDQQEMDVKFDFKWDFLRADGGSTPTVEEFLKQVGVASAYVSSDPDTCQPFAVDVILLYVPPCGGTKNEKIVCPLFRYESLAHDAKSGQVSVSGKCNVTQATVTRQVGVTI